jgi:hypothetical protein
MLWWVNTKSEVEGGGAEAEHGSDAGGGNKSGLGGGVRKERKRERGRRGRGAGGCVRLDGWPESKHRARKGMASAGMANLFPLMAFFWLVIGED